MRNMVNQEAVINRIKALRAEKGLSQQDLADRIGVTRQSVCNVETNPLGARACSLIKLADAMGCRITDFFVEE